MPGGSKRLSDGEFTGIDCACIQLITVDKTTKEVIPEMDIFKRLGLDVKPIINAAGTETRYGGAFRLLPARL